MKIPFEFARPYSFTEIVQRIRQTKKWFLNDRPILSGWIDNIEFVFADFDGEYRLLGYGRNDDTTKMDR